MKFCKNMLKVVELSDPEWSPFWVNYKFLKKKLNEIVEAEGAGNINATATTSADQGDGKSVHVSGEGDIHISKPENLMKSAREVEFFRLVHSELKKTSEFFSRTENLFVIRLQNLEGAVAMLKASKNPNGEGENKAPQAVTPNAWGRLLVAVSRYYKEILLLENFAIMNYCGFSKILKKHDKVTGFKTREAFMRNVMTQQNFTHYPRLLDLLKRVEDIFNNIKIMEADLALADEERLFIEAMRGLNATASKLEMELTSMDGDEKEDEEAARRPEGETGSSSSSPNKSSSQPVDNKTVCESELDVATSAVMSAAALATGKKSHSPGTLIGWVSAMRNGEEDTSSFAHPSVVEVEKSKRKGSEDSGNDDGGDGKRARKE